MTQNAALGTLDRADGSATYSANGYEVICGVNGPIEVQRRDELPGEAAIEVNIRPASGVGGVRERHLESIVLSSLRHIILTTAHPRTLIQVTLQIVRSHEDESNVGQMSQAASNIDVLPSLFQAATFALLSAAISLTATLTSTLLAIDIDETVIANPTVNELAESMSLHVLAFSSLTELICVESEGKFSIDQWAEIERRARQICLGSAVKESVDVDMGDAMATKNDKSSLQDHLSHVMQEKFNRDHGWRENEE